jgi:hypothetical protein
MGRPVIPTLARALVLVSLLVSLACNHEMVSIRATPNEVCSGSPVKLEWTSTANPTITASTKVAGLDNLPRCGSKRVVVGDTTTFTLDAGCPITHSRTQASVTVVKGIQSPTIGHATDIATCTDDGFVSVTFAVDEHYWDPLLVVGKVSSPDARIFRVSHGGKQNELTPTNAFAGMPVSGAWTIATGLKPDEGCDGGKPLPNLLGVVVTSTCPAKPETP